MKNLNIILLAILSIIVSACSSDNDGDSNTPNSEYYISFEVNDKKVEYTTVLSASNYDNLANGLYGVGLTGADPDNALLIFLYDTTQITTNTYTGEIIPNKYISSAIISYGTPSEGFTSAAPNISSVANANVMVTEISSTYIAGNFTGVLVSNSDYNTATHTIKNGKFKIKFIIQ